MLQYNLNSFLPSVNQALGIYSFESAEILQGERNLMTLEYRLDFLERNNLSLKDSRILV